MAQRPHYFCQDLLTRRQAAVTWLEPMPSRFPRWQDFLGFCKAPTREVPSTLLHVVPTPTLPVETVSDWLTDKATAALRRKILLKGSFDWIVLGKPSRLGLTLARELKAMNPQTRLLWDCMDNMPAFHRGRAAVRMLEHERALREESDVIWVSSQRLYSCANASGARTLLVPNGLHAAAYSKTALTPPGDRNPRNGLVLGYLGSIAPWFDWEALIALASARPKDTVQLIGPLHCAVPRCLPRNVTILPPVASKRVPSVLTSFDWGLIPFLQNQLTEAVDPIKYYEYRAADLPILSTDFGDMRSRGHGDAVWKWKEILAKPFLLDEILQTGCPTTSDWISQQDWAVRFEAAWQRTDALFSHAYKS